jgi:hypothetical protein
MDLTDPLSLKSNCTTVGDCGVKSPSSHLIRRISNTMRRLKVIRSSGKTYSSNVGLRQPAKRHPTLRAPGVYTNIATAKRRLHFCSVGIQKKDDRSATHLHLSQLTSAPFTLHISSTSPIFGLSYCLVNMSYRALRLHSCILSTFIFTLVALATGKNDHREPSLLILQPTLNNLCVL